MFYAAIMPALCKKRIIIISLAFDTSDLILKIFTVVTKISITSTLKNRDGFFNART